VTPATLALLAGLAGASIAALSASIRPWVVALTAAVMAFETVALRSRFHDGPDPFSTRLWRRLELVGLVVGVKFLQVLSGSSALVDLEFGIAVATGLAVWGLANATLTDLDAIERAIEVTEGSSPLQRIRLRFMAIGLLGVVCAAFGAVRLDGFLDMQRSAAASWSPAPLAYFLIGLVALGMTSRMTEDRRWRRDGAVIDGQVPGRWRSAVLLTVGFLGVFGALVQSVTTGVSAAPVSGLGATGRLGAWLVDRTNDLRAVLDAADGTAEVGGESVSASPPEFDLAEPVAPWLGDVALWGFLALIFASAIYRGLNRRAIEVGGDEAGLRARDVMRMVWRAFVAFVTGFLKRLRRFLGRERSDRETSGGRTGWRDDSTWWVPNDPIRRRIAIAYRRAVDAIAPDHGPRRHPETPRELAGRVADDRFVTVTSVFEEARYSIHVLTDSDATRAETAADDLDS
jgi:hypothetical protein